MSRKVTFVLFALLILGGVVLFVYYKKHYFPKYNWYPDYRKKSDQPYGLKLMFDLLKEQKDGVTVFSSNEYLELDTTLVNTNFITVGNEFFPDSINGVHLLKYVENGNCLFISSEYAPLEIITHFVPIGDTIHGYADMYDSIVHVNFTQDSLMPFREDLRFHHQFLKDTTSRGWTFYEQSYFNDTLAQYGFVPISNCNKQYYGGFYINHGKGKIVVHANPFLFTNYCLTQKNGYKHLANFMSMLNKGPIYWDDPLGNQSRHGNNEHGTMQNPLRFLFSNDSFRWAWYVFLITVLLYLLFRSKREQRIIPILPVNTNASIEYTKAIGTLYFQTKNHQPLAHELYIVFMAEVRNRYNLPPDLPEQELVSQLSTRSGIAQNVIYNLFKQFKRLREDKESTSDDLIALYKSIENYHKKRK